jgi:hypothetical protein
MKRLILAFVWLHCAAPPAEGKAPRPVSKAARGDPMTTDCVTMLKSLQRTPLSELRWPGPCLLSAVVAAFGKDALSEAASGRLGEEGRQVFYHLLRQPGQDPLRLWVSEGSVVMVDWERPRLFFADQRERLGAPAAQLDFGWNVLTVSKGEWVYPDRGLAVLYNPPTGAVLRVLLFPATTLAAYRQALRTTLAVRER